MASDSRRTFLYKLDANCTDLLPQTAGSTAADCMREHFAYLKELHERGDIILFGLTLNPDPSAVSLCVFYADSEAQAQSILANDPFVSRGLARGTLFPFHIALQGERAA
jgi:uncharacterized protein YciI